MLKEISFDGFKFWLNGECIGFVSEKNRLRSPIPKHELDAEKLGCIERLVELDLR